jgi:transcriptional regulator with XRE-family HTH domain
MDTMISTMMFTPNEMSKRVAAQAKAKRLAQNLSQHTLSERSGVSYGVLKKFERTGQISLESLLKLALSVGSFGDFEHLFSPDKPEMAASLDELMNDTTRKRGRK